MRVSAEDFPFHCSSSHSVRLVFWMERPTGEKEEPKGEFYHEQNFKLTPNSQAD